MMGKKYKNCQHEAAYHLVCVKCGKLVDDKYAGDAVCSNCHKEIPYGVSRTTKILCRECEKATSISSMKQYEQYRKAIDRIRELKEALKKIVDLGEINGNPDWIKMAWDAVDIAKRALSDTKERS